MQGQSYQLKTVLEQYDARNKSFLALQDGPGNPLGRLPRTVLAWQIGFGVGDVVCMYCSNFVEYWTIAVAAWSCGGCIMPTNCELEPRQLEDQGGGG